MNKKIYFYIPYLLILFIFFIIGCEKVHKFNEIIELRALFFYDINNLYTDRLKEIFLKKETIEKIKKAILPEHDDIICLPENSGLFSEIRGHLYDLKDNIDTFFILSIDALEEKGLFRKRLLFKISDIEDIRYDYVITSWDFDFDIKQNKNNSIDIHSKTLNATFKVLDDTRTLTFIVNPNISSDIYIISNKTKLKQHHIKSSTFGNIYYFYSDKTLKKDTTYKMMFSDFKIKIPLEKEFDFVFKPIRNRDFRIDIFKTIPTSGKITFLKKDLNIIFPYEKKLTRKKGNNISVKGESNFNNLLLLTHDAYSHFRSSDIDYYVSSNITDHKISEKHISIFNSILSDITGLSLKERDIYIFSGSNSGIMEYPLILLNPKTLYRRPDGSLMTFDQTLRKNLLHELTHLYTGTLPHYNPYFYEGITTFIEYFVYSGLYNDDLLRFIDNDISIEEFIEIFHGRSLDNLLKRDDEYYTGAAFFHTLFKHDREIIKKILNKKAPAHIADALDLY